MEILQIIEKVYDMQKEKTGKDRKRQRGAGEKKLDEKLNISIYSIFIITH